MIAVMMYDHLLLILEPGNMEHLKSVGVVTPPDSVAGGRVAIAYTPDVEWVTQQIGPRVAQGVTPEELQRVLRESMSRPEVLKPAKRAPEEFWRTMPKLPPSGGEA